MADKNNKKPERDHLSDHLVEWAPVINMHVSKMKGSLPPHVDHEDLYAAGMHGLIDAFHKYDSRKGASFKSYASRRIKHKMQDHVSSGGPNAVDKFHYTQAKKFLNPKSGEGSEE